MRVMAPILAGYVVWAAAFLGIYALQATGCAGGWPGLRVMLLAAMGLAIAANGAALLWSARADQPFARNVGLTTNATALLASALTFSGVVWMPLCG